ncbi:MAG: carbohydrate ABC transporter substrate-binding protein [Acidimicrobiales bacterium]|nr:carbohydrate ABC transporter substrate-binding protein [Acidimicrobiales bacterium]
MNVSKSLRRFWRFVALTSVLVLVVAACGGDGGTTTTAGGVTTTSGQSGTTEPGGTDTTAPGGGEELGGEVTVYGTWGGAEEEAFRAMVAPFEEATGVEVQYTGTRDINTVLSAGVQSGILPDLAGLPGPGQMAEWAQLGALVDLSTVIDYDTYVEQTSPGFVELGTVDGQLVGVFIKAAVKGLIWYNPNVWTGGDLDSWDDVVAAATAHEGAEAGWCIGLESGAASGWPGTDWIEDFVIRQSGPEVYDAWYQGQHPWTSPEIRAAFEAYGEAVANSYGGSQYAIATNFGDAGQPLFTDPPGCLFHHQASFMAGEFFPNYPQSPQPGEDFDFFVMPTINPDFQGALTGAGDLFGMFNDTPQARALMQWLVSPEAQQIWVDRGGAISGNNQVTEYPDPISQKSAEALARAEVFRFDASDLMPEAMNAAFWQAVLDYTQNPGQLDSILANLDQVQADAYGG